MFLHVYNQLLGFCVVYCNDMLVYLVSLLSSIVNIMLIINGFYSYNLFCFLIFFKHIVMMHWSISHFAFFHCQSTTDYQGLLLNVSMLQFLFS